VATESKVASRGRFWRIVLLVLVVLPLLPEIMVLSVSAIADLSGCRVDEPPAAAAVATRGGPNVSSQVPPDPWIIAKGLAGKACAIGPFPVSSTIRLALEAGFLVGVSFGSGAVVIWLALCYVSITRGWTDLLSRLTLAFLVSLIFSFVPYFGPMMSIASLDNPLCQPNEGGVGPCVMYGGDVGRIVHDNVYLGWQLFTGGPVALGAFALYLLFLFIASYASRRRTPRSV
jgi:hypothetical protein